MTAIRMEQDVRFMMSFYEQPAEAILKVVETARRAHRSITGWSQLTDQTSAGVIATVILKFNDRASMEDFARDRQLVDMYLEYAWGKRALTHDALRPIPPIAECGIIPSEMFADVGF